MDFGKGEKADSSEPLRLKLKHGWIHQNEQTHWTHKLKLLIVKRVINIQAKLNSNR